MVNFNVLLNIHPARQNFALVLTQYYISPNRQLSKIMIKICSIYVIYFVFRPE